MARLLTLHRRRANLVDLTLQVQPGVAAYQFQAATNFDAAFTTFDTVPSGGKASQTATDLAIDGSSKFRGLTRFLFNPADYATTGVSETKPMFVRVLFVPFVGAGVTSVPGTPSGTHMVLPYDSSPDRPIVLNGTAPGATSMTGSLELQLPGQCRNLQIQVNGAADMWVAFEPGGPEFRIPALSVEFTSLSLFAPVVTQLFFRGDGAATTFNAVMGLKNNPLG